MSQKPKKRSRKRALAVSVGILMLLCLLGWFWLNSFVRSKIESQLASAGFDRSEVASVQVGFGGVVVHDIELKIDGVDLNAERIVVHQSILELANGTTPIESLEIEGATVSVDASKLSGESSFSFADLDLGSLDVPVKNIDVRDIEFQLIDEDGAVGVEIDEANLAVSESAFVFSGSGSSLEGQLEFSGEIQKQSADLRLGFSGKQLHLADQQWQRWPGIGPAVQRHLGADAVFDVTGGVDGNLKTGVKYLANVDTQDAWLYIPKFDLPIAVHEAKIKVQDGLVTYEKVIAGMGKSDVVNATGTTSIDGLPCRSKFEGDFSDVDVAHLRKLVKEIPSKVFGTATGKVVGSVDVNDALETTLRIDAKGDTKSAGFGEIAADSGNVDVQIQPLVLTQLGKTVDLQGSVTVLATTKDQDVDGVLATFDLQELDRQFEFEMLGTGDVELVIPLNSAADLRTWTLEIEAEADRGAVGGLALQDMRIKSFLQEGQLVFEPATANLAGNPQASIQAKVVWPLPNRAVESISPTGVVEVNANQIGPTDAINFFQRQMKNAKIEYGFQPQLQTLANSELDGELNLVSRIELPSSADTPIESWDVSAAVSDSTLEAMGQTLSNLKSKITIKDGELSIVDLKSEIEGGGNVSAGGRLNLETRKLSDVQLTANKFPAAWLGATIVQMDSTGEFADRTGLDAKNVSKKLFGSFNANIRIDPANEGRILWEAASQELSIFGKSFRNVLASGKYDSAFDIKRIKTDLPGGGNATLDGDWIAGSDDGKFNLKWKHVSLAPLLEGQINLPGSFESFSDGEMQISFVDSKPVFEGEFDLIEPHALGATFADHRFAIETVDDRIHFRDIPDQNIGISLEGSFSSRKPYDFNVNGQADSMPLSTAIFDKLSGVATTNFQLSGQAKPWSVKTVGEASFENLAYEKERLSDIRVSWDFDTSDPDSQQLKIIGFGGTATLDSKRRTPDDIVFEVDEIELSELAAFRKLPVELSGAVTGSATIENWNSPSERSIKGSAQSDQIKVGQTRLSRVIGTVSLTNGGKLLEYSLNSQLIDGKLECSGKTELSLESNPFENVYPLTVRLVNGRLNRLAESVTPTPIEALKQLQGRVSVLMDWNVKPGAYPSGSGRVTLEDVKYRNRLASRKILSNIVFDDGIARLERIRADLQQGEIAGRAVIPLVGSASGSYRLDVRNFSLPRMLSVLIDDPIEASGLVSARISGRTGRAITGSGTLGLSQAGLFGTDSQSMKVPVRFRLEPNRGTAKIEMPNTRFRAFGGTFDGSASFAVGSSLRLESKLQLSNVDSQSLVRSLTGYVKPGNGKLSGKLEVSGRNMRDSNDLNGSFRGKLEQSNALSFPLLDQITRFLGSTASLRNDKFDSDTIELSLSKGRIDVKQFRLQSSLVSILVTGSAWLGGKLDFEVAARVERLNQPTLLDQLAGSPIARLAGPEAAFIAQAAEFLSERIIFLDVGGTASRPQIRINPGKQLKEEAIRYFLRGSQIFPNANVQNN